MNFFKEGWTIKGVEEALVRDDPEELIIVPIAISLYATPDCSWSESVCVRLANHSNANVRGNAILGFGHLARICGKLDRKTVKPLIMAALNDSDEYVRMHAYSATDDIKRFLRWRHFGYKRRKKR